MARKRNAKKKSFLKRFLLWLIILFGVFSIAYHYFGDMLPQKYQAQIDQYIFEGTNFTTDLVRPWIPYWESTSTTVVGWFDFSDDEQAELETDLGSLEVEAPEVPVRKELRLKPTTYQRGAVVPKGYYIKIGNCMDQSCINGLGQSLRTWGYSAVAKAYRQKLDLFEVSSTWRFRPEEALHRLKLVETYNQTSYQPTIQKVGGKRKISFGAFPEKMRANELLGHLLEIQAQTHVEFGMLKKRTSFTGSKVYAGPFQSLKDVKIAQRRLKQSQMFVEVSIQTKI